MRKFNNEKMRSFARLFFCNALLVLLGGCGGGSNIGSKLDIPAPKAVPKIPQVSVFAGETSFGRSGDGPVSTAGLQSPYGLAVDQLGNIFFADYQCTLRKISPNGVVTTFVETFVLTPLKAALNCSYGLDANGQGTFIRFNGISALTAGVNGRIFIAADGGVIRYIDLAGKIDTLAGSGNYGDTDGNGITALFSNPGGLAADGIGNIYVADTSNGRIRKIAPNRDVTTIFDFRKANISSYPTAIAVDLLDNLYVVDEDANAVYKINQRESNTVTALVKGIGVAPLSRPRGVAVDTSGNVFVSDAGNRVIRKISINGNSTIFAGEFGIAGARDGFGVGARFTELRGLATDSVDNVYVADSNGTIRKISSLGVVTTVVGSAEVYGSDDGIGNNATFGQDYSVGMVGSTSSTGNQVRNRMSKDSQGNLYIADTFNHVIRKVTVSRQVTTIAGKAGIRGGNDGRGEEARFSFPTGIVLDSDDTIYVTDSENNTIRKISKDGRVTTFAGTLSVKGRDDGIGISAKFNHPSSIALDPRGFLVVADADNKSLRRITKTGVVTSLQLPIGKDILLEATADNDGNYFFRTVLCSCIFKMDINGVVSKFVGGDVSGKADGKGNAARFDALSGLNFDEQGNIFTSDLGGLRKITPDGVVTTLNLGSNNSSFLVNNFIFVENTGYGMSENAIYQVLNAK